MHSERIFSSAGNTVDKKKATLDTDQVDRLVFVVILNSFKHHVFKKSDSFTMLTCLQPVVALPAELLQGVHKDARLSTCNQELTRHPAYSMCLLSAL